MGNYVSYLLFFGETQQYIEKDPGIIVGPITRLLGMILNFLYKFSIIITPEGFTSIVFALILLTIVTRIFLLPLAIRQQETIYSMRKLDPLKEKIQKKYADAKDKEAKAKMSQEIQRMYAENGVNTLAGCIPALIQLPIFLALSTLMRQTYLYISHLNNIYNEISEIILSLPGYLNGKTNEYFIIFNNNFVQPMLPKKIDAIDLFSVYDINRVISKFNYQVWDDFLSGIPVEYSDKILILLEEKNGIQTFFGISLIENAGFMWPGIIIPILAAVSTFLSSYIMMKQQPNMGDTTAAQITKSMTYMMPILMFFMTINFPVGVGVYWITSSFFQVGQQIGLDKYYKSEKGKLKLENRLLKRIEAKKLKMENKKNKLKTF